MTREAIESVGLKEEDSYGTRKLKGERYDVPNAPCDDGNFFLTTSSPFPFFPLDFGPIGFPALWFISISSCPFHSQAPQLSPFYSLPTPT